MSPSKMANFFLHKAAMKEAMKERDNAQQVAQESKSNEDWKKFRKLRNNLT